jgi:hypothetical protein
MSKRHPSRTKKGPRHANLPRDLLKDPAVATLPGAIFKVFVALNAEYCGKNNGALSMTRELARAYGVTSVDTLTRALSGNAPRGELIDRGLVVITDPGSYKPARVARYALTCRPLDNTEYSRSEHVASHTYRTWLPPPALLEQRAKRKERADRARKKQRQLSDGRTQSGPVVGPKTRGEVEENSEMGPVVGPNRAANGSGGRTPSRDLHVSAAMEGGES